MFSFHNRTVESTCFLLLLLLLLLSPFWLVYIPIIFMPNPMIRMDCRYSILRLHSLHFQVAVIRKEEEKNKTHKLKKRRKNEEFIYSIIHYTAQRSKKIFFSLFFSLYLVVVYDTIDTVCQSTIILEFY